METSSAEEEGSTLARYRTLADLIVGRTLVRLIGDEAEWSELVSLALSEGVGPLLACKLRDLPHLDLPPSATETLDRSYTRAVFLSLLYRSVRSRLCEQLAGKSIPILLLKGGALTLTSYRDPATRPMCDLDVLIPRPALQEAARCLEEDGFTPYYLPRSLIPSLNRPHVHLVYTHPIHRAVVELHWELHFPEAIRRAAVTEIWAEAQPAPDDVPAQVMRPGHMIPLACAHMTLQHKSASLLWLHDLHQILLRLDKEEAACARRSAVRWRLGSATALSLLRVRELFGTPLPDDLAAWAAATAARPGGLQTRVAALALTPGAAEMPHSGMLNLLLNRDWRFLRSMVPAPEVVRERLQLAPNQSVMRGYLALMTRTAQQAPRFVRQFYRCWRHASLSRSPQPPRGPRTH